MVANTSGRSAADSAGGSEGADEVAGPPYTGKLVGAEMAAVTPWRNADVAPKPEVWFSSV